MVDYFLVKVLNRSIRALQGVGVPHPLPPDLKTYRMYLWWMYSFIMLALNSTFLLTIMAGIPSAMSDIALFATAVFPLTITLQVILRRVCLWQHNESLRTAVQDLNQVSRDLEKSRYLKNSMDSRKMVIFVQLLQPIRFVLQNSYIFYLSAYLFQDSWQGKSTTTPVIAWYPFNQKEPKINLFVIALQEMSILANMLIIGATDLFLITLVVVPSLLYVRLAEILKCIMKEAYDGNRKEAWEDLLWWLKCHQALLRALSQIRKFFSSILLIYYSLTLIEVMVSLLVVLSEDSSWDPFHKFVVASSGLLTLSLFFLLCLVGENFINKEDEVSNRTYGTNMILSSIKFKKTFYFIHMRNKIGTTLGVYGLYQLSLRTFSTLIQATFSVYLTLLQLKLKTTEHGEASN